MKVEVKKPKEMADEIGELISLYHRTRKGLLSDEPSFAGKHPELYRLYLELRVTGDR